MILRRIGSDTSIRFDGETNEFTQGQVVDFDSVNELGRRNYKPNTDAYILKHSRGWEAVRMVPAEPEIPVTPVADEADDLTDKEAPVAPTPPVVPPTQTEEEIAEAKKQATIAKGLATRKANKEKRAALVEEAQAKQRALDEAEKK